MKVYFSFMLHVELESVHLCYMQSLGDSVNRWLVILYLQFLEPLTFEAAVTKESEESHLGF